MIKAYYAKQEERGRGEGREEKQLETPWKLIKERRGGKLHFKYEASVHVP